MSDMYKQTKRLYLIDHHSPQPPLAPLGHMDIDEYSRFFDEAKLDSLMVYCKDHWGVTYYDSRVPGAQKHKGVEGDWIRAKRDECAKKGIEFVAYYCIEYDEGAARAFPEWRALKADGTPLIREDLYARWSICCYQTGYREYVLSQLEEIIDTYHPDALFLDIFGASLCYCDSCRKKFMNKYGYPLPESEAELMARREEVTAFLDDNAAEFYREMDARLKAIDPALAITINFSCHYPKAIRDLMDFQYSEPLLKDNWFSSAYARDTAKGKYPILAPGEASTVYNYDHTNKYICDLSMIAAQGCRVGMYSGSQHIDGTLEHEEARRLGAVYEELSRLSPWFTETRTPAACVGILQSDRSKAFGSDPFQPDAIIRMKRHSSHTDAVLGAMMACEYAKLPYTILPEDEQTPESLRAFQLILIPEVYTISADMVSMLKAYVSAGGKVIVDARTGLKGACCDSLTGCIFDKINEDYTANDWSAYLTAVDPEQFAGLAGCTTPPVCETFTQSRAVTAEVLAYLTTPCIQVTPTDWINWWSPPPGDVTDWPGIAVNSIGEGAVIYLAFDYFTMCARETFRDCGDLFKDLVALLDITPVVCNETAIPNTLRTAFFEEEDCYHVHQISTIPSRHMGDLIPISGGTLVFSRPVASARLVYPREQALTIEHTAKGWEIALPDFELQQFIVIDK